MEQIFLNGVKLADLLNAFRFIVKDELQKEKESNENESHLKVLTIEEAAEFLNLAKPTIYRLVSERNIPFAKKGKRLYFSTEKLTEWVESGEVRTQAQIRKEVNK